MENQNEWSFGSPSTHYRSFRPDTPLLQFCMATADPMLGMNYPSTPDILNPIRRSRSRSVGITNSPSQLARSMPWMGSPGPRYITNSPFNSFRPLSSSSNMLPPQSPLMIRPPSTAPRVNSHSPLGVNQRPRPPVPENRRLGETATTRAQKFKPSQWESREEKIKELFLDEDKSLDETMRFMEEHFSFNPSRVPLEPQLR